MVAPKNYLIVILGPTGVGKTDLSIKLSQQFNAPIISADSRQFYREMRIGTAAPLANQLNAAPHHFIGHKSVADRYTCGMFELDALNMLEELFQSHRFIIMAGGSMLYIDAVCKGIDDFPIPDPELRQSLEQQLRDEGIENMRAQLKLLDPTHYQQIDLKNSQRVLKAVEVCLQTGKPYSSFLTNPMKIRPFHFIKIGLNLPREELYAQINSRVDGMIKDGLIDEAKGLLPFKNNNALKTVGYHEIFDYLEGKTTLEQAVELIKRNSRRYAKRQLTWWARDKEIVWFSPDDEKGIKNYIEKVIA